MSVRRRTRVLFTLDFPPKDGGIAEWSVQVARALSRAGERVAVFCRSKVLLSDSSLYGGQGFEVVPMGGRNWAGLKHLYLLYYTFKLYCMYGPSTVYATNWELSVIPILFSGALRLNVVIAAHGWEITQKGSRIRSRLERYALSHADRVLAVSRYTKDRVLEAGGKLQRVEIVSNGVDTHKFSPQPPRDDLVEKFGLCGKRVILTLSRIVERKGHDVVIRALPRVLEEVPNVRYLIGGRGNYRAILEGQIERLGLGEHVCFAGYVPDERLGNFYNLSEIYIMPCRELKDRGDVEGFGITFLEAGACGLPVIGGRSGGVEDAIVDGETGFLVDPLDEEEVAETILRLLKDPHLARKMGEAGRRRAQKLSWDSVGERILELSGYNEGY